MASIISFTITAELVTQPHKIVVRYAHTIYPYSMDWWKNTPAHERATITHIQIKVDNGPESNGVRTQFLKRMVEFADHTSKNIQLLHYPPYHSKYNPIERCWGILEEHWNGAKLVTVETMLEWAKSMTWKGIKPMVNTARRSTRKEFHRLRRRCWRLNPDWIVTQFCPSGTS